MYYTFIFILYYFYIVIFFVTYTFFHLCWVCVIWEFFYYIFQGTLNSLFLIFYNISVYYTFIFILCCFFFLVNIFISHKFFHLIWGCVIWEFFYYLIQGIPIIFFFISLISLCITPSFLFSANFLSIHHLHYFHILQSQLSLCHMSIHILRYPRYPY